MKRFSFLFLTMLLGNLLSCSGQHTPVTIVPLPMLSNTDTIVSMGRTTISRSEYFLVQKYNDDKITNEQIRLFALSKKESLKTIYSNYNVFFYKESAITSLEGIRKDKKEFDRYSFRQDMIFGFWWINGKYAARYKYKNGEIIDPKSTVTVN